MSGQEKNFENKVKQFLKENGCWFIKYWAGSEFTKAGVPDILACIHGRFVGIEVKAPNGRYSPLQIHNLKKIDASGGLAVLLYPKDFDLFKKMVKSLEDGSHHEYYEELKKRWIDG